MKKFVLALGLALCVSSGASAATGGECYTAKEFEAEQGIRIHSELMVIGLTCMKMPHGPQMYMKYKDFTEKNKKLIAQYENEIISHYRREGAEKPEKKLHTLRTTLANQISQRAVTMSVSSFCQRFSPRIDQALAMDKEKLRRWAQQPWTGSPTSRPICDSRSAGIGKTTVSQK